MDFSFFVVALLVLAGIVWAVAVNLRYQAAPKALKLLQDGHVYEGLCALTKTNQWTTILSFLSRNLALPDENLRPRVVETVLQVRALHTAAQDMSPAMPEPLREHIAKEANAALDALWLTCHRLSVAARLEVDATLLQTELETERTHLRQLYKATETAKLELARLNLAGGQQPIAEATERFSQLSWAAQELRRLDDTLKIR